MTAGSIRWGVLSTAKIAREKVAPAIHAAHNGVLHAVASRDVGRAQAFARDLEIPTAYGSYDELLADDAIDAVYIPLPTSFHHRWVIKAAEAGKHILCDKPFASDARQAEQMVAACTAASVQLIEGFMYRYDPRHQRVRELLAAGAIGDLRRVRVVFSFLIAPDPANVRLSAELDGGVWGDLGCYCVSISRLYMQQEPTWIQASLEYDDELGVDIDGSAIMGFGPQRRALVDFSFITGAQQCLEVAGTEGRIVVPQCFISLARPGVVRIERRSNQAETVEELPAEPFDTYVAEVENLGAAIRGEAQPRVPGSEAVRNMRVLDALRASARGGRRVPIA